MNHDRGELVLQRVCADGIVVVERFDEINDVALAGANPPDIFQIAAAALVKHASAGSDGLRFVATLQVRMSMDLQAMRDDSDVLIELPLEEETDPCLMATGVWRGIPILLDDGLT